MNLPEAASVNQAVRALLGRLDRHDAGQRAHATRVAVYAVAAGERLGLSDEDLATLRLAALLHDVGKLALEPALLSKAGPVTADEVGRLRSHAAAAESALAPYPWAQGAIPVVLAHHERADGSGYPEGRADPSLASQLVGLAEGFDVQAHGAVWRPGSGRQAAVRWAEAEAGRGFAREAVEALLAVEPLIQPVGFP